MASETHSQDAMDVPQGHLRHKDARGTEKSLKFCGRCAGLRIFSSNEIYPKIFRRRFGSWKESKSLGGLNFCWRAAGATKTPSQGQLGAAGATHTPIQGQLGAARATKTPFQGQLGAVRPSRMSIQGQLDAARPFRARRQSQHIIRFSLNNPKLLQVQQNCSACTRHCRWISTGAL